jgi:hypothetical protein
MVIHRYGQYSFSTFLPNNVCIQFLLDLFGGDEAVRIRLLFQRGRRVFCKDIVAKIHALMTYVGFGPRNQALHLSLMFAAKGAPHRALSAFCPRHVHLL